MTTRNEIIVRRRKIMAILSQGPMSLKGISEELGYPLSTMRLDFKALKAEGEIYNLPYTPEWYSTSYVEGSTSIDPTFRNPTTKDYHTAVDFINVYFQRDKQLASAAASNALPELLLRLMHYGKKLANGLEHNPAVLSELKLMAERNRELIAATLDYYDQLLLHRVWWEPGLLKHYAKSSSFPDELRLNEWVRLINLHTDN